MVLLAAAQRHLLLRLIFVLVLLGAPASPIELPKIDGQGPLNWVRHASILSGLPDGFGRSASQTLVSVGGHSLSLHKSIPGTIVDLWREREALSWIVATEDTVREGYRALHVGFLCTDRGRVMSTATTAVANTNTAGMLLRIYNAHSVLRLTEPCELFKNFTFPWFVVSLADDTFGL
jgi:hypothetical protein